MEERPFHLDKETMSGGHLLGVVPPWELRGQYPPPFKGEGDQGQGM